MNPPPALTGAHRRTDQTIFQHPVSHHLGWHDVHELCRQLGQVEEEPNGNLKVTRHGQTLILPPPRTKDVAQTDALMKIRNFLERSEIHGTVPARIRLRQTDDAISHVHRFDGFSRGQEKPAPQSFFGPVAEALKAAGRILIFGSGTGTANEIEQFVAWLKIHHPGQAGRIAGVRNVDAPHPTDAPLLAKARDFFCARPEALK